MREPLRVEDEITGKIIGAAIEVHKHLGPGLLESAYQACLAHELSLRGIQFKREKVVPLVYKQLPVETAYRADFIVENLVVVELKAVKQFEAIHQAQLMSYLKLANLKLGLLLNFNVRRLKAGGIKRVALNL
ncbi:MAG: GxxExxY protein [Ardenticatenaceae bacterium]|nr:GxxExxY protein [Anaerolineales bacterium]MCB9006943.1 GxxExxY protein [Ardenticatenaceae bacterium]